MFINLNPGQIGLGQADFYELVEKAPRHGFQGIDLQTRQINTVDKAKEAHARVQDAGLQWGLFPLPFDYYQGTDEAFEHGCRELEALLPIVEAAGCKRAYNHIWPGSNERSYDDNFDWHVNRLRRVFALLNNAGIHYGLEFVGPKTLQDTFAYPFLRTLPETIRLADAVSSDVGIVLDAFHLYTSGGTLDDVEALLTADRIVNVHVNDAQAGRSREEQMDLERAMPMASGIVDTPGLIRLLNKMHYQGPVICEPFNPAMKHFAAMLLNDALHEVGMCMQRLFAEAGVKV